MTVRKSPVLDLPATLWLGAAVILASEVLLALDVMRRGVAVLPAPAGQPVAAPEGLVGELARWVAVHMTPVCWVGYLLVADGVLAGLGHRRGAGSSRGWSPARWRLRRFAVCFVTSVGVWLFFDWVNFSFIHAWDYHGIEPLSALHAWSAKFVAFGAISPAMFLAAELYQRLGLRRLCGRPLPVGRRWQVAAFVIGVPALLFPFWVRQPIGCMTLWVALFLLLDPLNCWLGGPSLIGDWQQGRYGRTAALMAGGLTCGFLWEFWNYWAAAKWTYDLPFLGPLESWKLFEMPLSGFSGFPPFALECWAAFQTIVLVMGRLRLRFSEPLPDPGAVL